MNWQVYARGEFGRAEQILEFVRDNEKVGGLGQWAVADSADFTTGQSMFLLLLSQRSVRTDSRSGLSEENATALIELLLQEDEAESFGAERRVAATHQHGTPAEESCSAASEGHSGDGVDYESDYDDVPMPSFEELEAAPFGVRLI